MNRFRRICPASSICAVLTIIWLGLGIEVRGQIVSKNQPIASNQADSFLQTDLPVATDTLQVTGAGPFLIRPHLFGESLHINTLLGPVESTAYTIDPSRGFITFLDVGPDSSFTFVATYQYIPLDLKEEYGLWVQASEGESDIETNRSPALRSPSRLESSGSITRGVLTGTGRDASIESGLRLEVEGQISDSIFVRAVLTDEDTPLLPEGTTSRLQQFDQVFIEFGSPRGKIALGDVDVSFDQGAFSTVRRRVQGVYVETTPPGTPTSWLPSAALKAVGSTSRGKYRSQFIGILEGVQGPYRLEGELSERFILVLPGTERVYIDGELLERGITSDYIIDYTTAEITFTPRRIVGSDSRVRVEFEYTSNQFSRSFLAADASFGIGRSRGGSLFEFGVAAMRESDGDAFASELGFSAQDSALVRASGDQLVFASGAIEVPYDPQALFTQYVLAASNSGVEIFEALSSAPTGGERVYRVAFTRVGQGSGSYSRRFLGDGGTGPTSNGIVFTFVGVGLGEYDPVKPLTAPVRKEMVDIRLVARHLPLVFVEGQWAGSQNDRNTLSPFDSADDAGRAISIGLRTKPVQIGRYRLESTTQFTGRSAHFATFDRVRDIEFEREWNLSSVGRDPTQNIVPGEQERLMVSSLGLASPDSSLLAFGYDALSLGSVGDFNRKRLDVRWMELDWIAASVRGKQVDAEDHFANAASQWRSLVSRVSGKKSGPVSNPYVEWEVERFDGARVGLQGSSNQELANQALANQALANQAQGNLLASERNPSPISSNPVEGISYDEFRAGGDIGVSGGNVSLFLEQRTEKASERWPLARTIRTIRSSWAQAVGSEFNSNVSVGLRYTAYNDGLDASTKPQNALLLGFDGNWIPGRVGRLTWLYQVQSEQSARLQEIYIRTGQERGEYVWQDINGDNAIQLDEFIPETTPGEGEYALTYFPSDSLETVTSLLSSVRFSRFGGGSGNRLSRIGLNTSVEVSEKSRDSDRSNIYLVRLNSFRKIGQTVSGRIRFSQDVKLFPSNRFYDLDLAFSESRSFVDLASGVQRSRLSERSVLLGYNPAYQWSFSTRITQKLDVSTASFSSRTFDIKGVEIRPTIAFRPQSAWLLSLGAGVSSKTERILNTRAISVLVPFAVHYQAKERWNVRANVEMASINVDGPSSGLQTYQLTEGRGPGSSWLWGFSVHAWLTEVLSATLGYDGRAPSSGSVIHTGRVQFMARF